MSITITQAKRELEYRNAPKATRSRDPKFDYGEACRAGGEQLREIAAKSTAKAPAAKAAKAPKAASPKAPKAKAPRKNPEANDAFKAAKDAGLGMKAAFRARKAVLVALAETVSA